MSTAASRRRCPPPKPFAHVSAHGWVGCRSSSEVPYDGTIDDLRIYARALDDAEIAALAP
jgi:hypothetical protein